MRLLLVDDDPMVLSATVRFATKLGHLCIPRRSGASAIEALEEGLRVDVIVLDHHMPGIHGRELLERIRAIVPSTPIVCFTGVDWVAHGQGYDCVFEKTTDLAKMFDALRGFLNGGLA